MTEITLPRNEVYKRLLAQIKALADEHRLEILYWLDQGECNVTRLATTLGLSEPTVSHHLAKLREAEFVTLRADKNQRFYRLNSTALNKFKTALQTLEKMPPSVEPESDDSWINALPERFSAADRDLLREMTVNGRLKQLPSQRHKREKLTVALRWLASKFESDILYTEKQVNEILKTAHDDFASMRRDMVDLGYLRRERSGRQYWLGSDGDIKVDYRDRFEDV